MPAFGSLFSFTPKPLHCLPLSWKTYPSGPVKFRASSCQSLSSQSPIPRSQTVPSSENRGSQNRGSYLEEAPLLLG